MQMEGGLIKLTWVSEERERLCILLHMRWLHWRNEGLVGPSKSFIDLEIEKGGKLRGKRRDKDADKQLTCIHIGQTSDKGLWTMHLQPHCLNP